ncbi:EAL domain-containing protein [Aureimonas sp. ME7]|uniref:putative bifunctional diguanylate cyclase/phosphodiesterase n=1 Tax=Aureimonas sp. ME7 TaxID=2744252 RepID=UPI0015F60D38|nr:EAL domain-containing protein [Aureimonas sp. ME7]
MSINAKLLASGLILGLLGAGFTLAIDRSNHGMLRTVEDVFRVGVDPLTRLEAAAVRSDELATRFLQSAKSSDPNGIVSRAETVEMVDGLSKILADLRSVDVEGRPVAMQLGELAYGINRLRMTDGEITRRLLRRELSTLVGDFDRAIESMRQDVQSLKDRSKATSSQLQTYLLAGMLTGSLVGAMLLAYLCWSIGRSIRQAAGHLLRAGGSSHEDAPTSSGDAIRQLELAIRFVESAIQDRSAEARQNQQATTERHQKELQAQRRRFDAALNNMPQAFCLLDDDAVVSANEAFFRLFPEVRIGTRMSEAWNDPLLAGLLAVDAPDVEHRETADGRAFELRRHANAQIGGTIVIFEDVTRQRAASREMEKLSGQDALTGLANRASFYGRLQEALQDGMPGGDMTLLSIDIADFNNINATLGHSAGDDLLRQMGERLGALVSPDDLVARLDGDEFGILVRSEGPPAAAGRRLAHAIMDDIERTPIRVAGRPLAVSVAVGMVAMQAGDPAAQPDAHAVMQDCEIALQEAKTQTGRRFKLYDPALREELQARQRMVTDLRLALERNEFEIHFQPFVDLRRQAVSGFEALARWRHPTRGQVSPGVFIPLMEEMGLIEQLGRFVLTEACRHAARWPANLSLSVNLSPVQVKNEGLVQTVRQILRSTGLAPERLQLEVTESLFLDDADGVLSTLEQLRKLGLVISMDDFGTGYSSLGYLSRFPFDKIKIDQSFVRDMERPENSAIVRAVMGLGAAMNMSVIAEGVETADQLMRLEQEGCVEMQGFLFSKPRPASDLPKMLTEVREGFAQGRYRATGSVVRLKA